MTNAPPPAEVLTAFGLRGSPVRLDGGQGWTWRVDDAVVKPAIDEVEAAWTARLLADLVEDGFRAARPIASSDGDWTVGGWSAATYLAGEHRLWDADWHEAVLACQRFHAALADVERPDFLDHRSDIWAVADRVAWGELVIDLPDPIAASVRALDVVIRPITSTPQVVHGDVAGNLLYADGLAPAVIDVSPYWRPGGYASAMVLVDAILWYGADTSVVTAADGIADLDQLLARALKFRLACDALLHAGEVGTLRWDTSQVAWDLEHAEPLIDWLTARDRDRGTVGD